MKLRSKHRIVGALVGTANSKGWSATEAGTKRREHSEVNSFTIHYTLPHHYSSSSGVDQVRDAVVVG